MRNDEIRAREQLEEIKVILKDSKLKMREYNLPIIPQSYYVELNEASSAIREIVKELDRKPITISILNTRVDTARDLVIKLYTKTCELLKTAALAETLLVYSNRYRSNFEGISNKLNLSEQLFLKGEYKKSYDLTINILKGLEPDIDERIIRYYELYRGDK
jgi:septation ring formation regulator